ncbi:ceramide synthase 4a isoform X2 [Hypanus sabinus]|nr:ceramide synthase 4a isoform X2 [Hypanus sabinus]XP_059847485.1 ceramide synthase 4a isoform X2 [Hypanus sabinus]XP_059847486.1 ceramide synthase 4a isoform X2 [Hypanus sabinus]XP_059847487.1 ceramide synthase 4a isoform X2 [Hypanus sabinus]
MTSVLDKWLWHHEYWLPPGITWKDMEDSEHAHYPRPRDLVIALPYALVFIVLRTLYERWIAVPLSKQMGVKEKIRRKVPPKPDLEKVYRTQSTCPKESDLLVLAKQCGISLREVKIWFRSRRNQDRPSITQKFCEASWRFAFYLLAFIAGLCVLLDKPWFWNQQECWKGYPQQVLLSSQYWYYMVELAFYWSLLLRVSLDVKRKDFKEQIIHHIATIFLIGFSYCANYIRVGTLVMLVHDASDYIMECAKMFNYAGWRRTCDVLFVVFALVFLITRLVIFPNVVIYTTFYYSMEIFQPFFGYYFFNLLLMVLQVLHIFWAYLILRMAVKFVFVGKIEKDERSDVDESDETEEDGRMEPKSSTNHNGVLKKITNGMKSKINERNRLPKAR